MARYLSSYQLSLRGRYFLCASISVPRLNYNHNSYILLFAIYILSSCCTRKPKQQEKRKWRAINVFILYPCSGTQSPLRESGYVAIVANNNKNIYYYY